MDLALYNSTSVPTFEWDSNSLMNAPAAFTSGLLLGFTLRAAVSGGKPAEAAVVELNSSESSDSEATPPGLSEKKKVWERKVSDEMAQILQPWILKYLKTHPLTPAKDMLNELRKQHPALTKKELNSCLYTLYNKGHLKKEMDGLVPYWMLKK